MIACRMSCMIIMNQAEPALCQAEIRIDYVIINNAVY